jgi:hypothetical protein
MMVDLLELQILEAVAVVCMLIVDSIAVVADQV